MSDQASHGVDPTPQISNADQTGVFKGADPAAPPPLPGGPGTQDGKTLPIGGADGQAGDLYKPAGLPDHLFGQNDRETLDRLAAAYKGARDEIAKGKPAVPKPEEYQWNWSDGLKGTIGKDDPAVKAFSEIAHEHGYTQQQIDAIPKLMDKLAEKGLIEKPFDASALLGDLAPEGFRGSPEEKQSKGGERLLQAESWIRQLSPQHGFDDAMKNELRLLTTSVAGVKVVETLMRSGMNPSVSGGGQPQRGATKGDLDARVADPRNDAFGPKYDPTFAEETRQMFKQVFG